MPSISPTARRKFARRILRASKKRSYRRIAREDYPMTYPDGKRVVKPGTLNRIVRDPDYFPTDEIILIALGLKKPHQPRCKPISECSTNELLEMLHTRRPLPVINHSQRRWMNRFMKNYIAQCRQASRQRARSS